MPFFPLTIFIVSKTCAVTLRFVLSHFSVVCKVGTANDTTNHFTIFSALGGRICTWGWDLCLGVGSLFLGFMDFSMALFSASSFSSLKEWCDVSLFILLIVEIIVKLLFMLS